MERPPSLPRLLATCASSPTCRTTRRTRRGFSWDAARDALAGLPGGGLNIAHEAVDRHAAGRAARTALRFVSRGAAPLRHQLRRAARLTNRFANVLRELGVGKGDRVFVLAGRIPELYVAVLGSLKNGSVVSPLFSAFGPEPIAHPPRHRRGQGAGHHRRAVPAQGARSCARSCPTLRHVLLVAERAAARRPTPGHARPRHADGRRVRRRSRSRRPRPRTRRCCTSPAAPPARPRARCTCTARWSRTTPPAASRSTCTPTTSSGAPPTRAG